MVAAAVVVLAHLPEFIHRLLDGDEAIYGSIAVLMNMGGGLYGAGGVDNKPPGVFWVYAVTFRLFGDYQMTAVHAAGFLAMAATCILLYLIARDLAGQGAGVLAALFYGVLTAAGNPRLLATNTEVLMMLPLTASVLFTLRRRWTWAGALLVAAGAFRQSAAVNVLLVAAAVFWLEPRERRLRALLSLAAGAAVALAIVAAVLVLTSSLAGFWRWTIQTLVGYASVNWTPAFVWMRARDSILPFVVDNAVLWIAAIALATRWRNLDAAVRSMFLWLVVAMLGSLAGGHLSWHYFIQAMGPLAVLAALAFVRFRPRRGVVLAAATAIAVPVVAWWVFDVTADPLTYDFASPVPQHEAVAAYVATHTSPSDRVFIWGDWPAVYVESDRVMASRFPGFLRGFARGSDVPPDNWDTAPDVWPLLQSDLEAHPPALIVDTAAAGWSDFEKYQLRDYPIWAFVAANYHQVAVVDGVVIYARNR
ncbi:MAG TPA: glycosyltransferase family 39 protein [Candidatus Dormibacteraeota bacterium]|nr:glycosyltransferase family 39 protein [Candidatus Dormibacteraeota bacterium]